MDNLHRVALAAFGIAAVFGAVANKTNFCTMGAVSDWVNMGDKGRLRAWFLGIGLATIAAQFMDLHGFINLDKSIYLSTSFGWLGSLFGGLCFGVGMTLGSGCGYRTLVRASNGNLKSLVVAITLAITAAMTLGGLLAPFRVDYVQKTNVDLVLHHMTDQSIPSFFVALSGVKNARLVQEIFAAIFGLGLVVYAFKDRDFRRSFDNMLAGVAIGVCVALAWYVTGVYGKDPFNPVPLASFTFIAPMAHLLDFVMTYTGSSITFGIAAMLGVAFGSFVYGVLSGRFRIETFSTRSDMIRHLVGGSLMGFGGVLGLGCTIGQGVTGMSTLALGSLITLVSIITGSALTQKIQYYLLDEQGWRHAVYRAFVDMRLMPGRKSA